MTCTDPILLEYMTIFHCDTEYSKSLVKKLYSDQKKLNQLREIKDVGKIANATYSTVLFLDKKKASEEMIDAVAMLHNLMIVPISQDFEKKYKFVAGWIEKDVLHNN